MGMRSKTKSKKSDLASNAEEVVDLNAVNVPRKRSLRSTETGITMTTLPSAPVAPSKPRRPRRTAEEIAEAKRAEILRKEEKQAEKVRKAAAAAEEKRATEEIKQQMEKVREVKLKELREFEQRMKDETLKSGGGPRIKGTRSVLRTKDINNPSFAKAILDEHLENKHPYIDETAEETDARTERYDITRGQSIGRQNDFIAESFSRSSLTPPPSLKESPVVSHRNQSFQHYQANKFFCLA